MVSDYSARGLRTYRAAMNTVRDSVDDCDDCNPDDTDWPAVYDTAGLCVEHAAHVAVHRHELRQTRKW